jgi:hypothetical protein
MCSLLQCMFDTNAFNEMLDSRVSASELAHAVSAHATHVQHDEISRTGNEERRAALLEVFQDVVAASIPTESFSLDNSRLDQAKLGGERVVPTASAVWGVSKWGQAWWGSEDGLYSVLKNELDQLNGSKKNNIQDALIAETALKANHVLITDDEDLTKIVRAHGGQCLSFEELMREVKQRRCDSGTPC